MQAWAYGFGTTYSNFIFCNKSGDDAKENLRRLVTQIDLLPEYLRFKSIVTDDGKIEKAKFSATKIESPITHNIINIKPKATSYDRALNLARGLSVPLIYLDPNY